MSKVVLQIVACLFFAVISGCGSSGGSSDNSSSLEPASNLVTPANLGVDEVWDTDEVWRRVNLRDDANIEITSNNPNNGSGSLEFSAVVVTSGQDKADLQTLWNPVDYPNRTVSGMTDCSYEFNRDSSSTMVSHFAPAFRLVIYNPSDGSTAYLIWEPAYNGYGVGDGGVPEDSWQLEDILNGNFWMYVTSGTTGTVQNYNSTLSDWLAGTVSGQPGDPLPVTVDANTLIVGLNIGIGSWWSTTPGDSFLGYVDNVHVAWGTDIVSANFEPTSL